MGLFTGFEDRIRAKRFLILLGEYVGSTPTDPLKLKNNKGGVSNV